MNMAVICDNKFHKTGDWIKHLFMPMNWSSMYGKDYHRQKCLKLWYKGYTGNLAGGMSG